MHKSGRYSSMSRSLSSLLLLMESRKKAAPSSVHSTGLSKPLSKGTRLFRLKFISSKISRKNDPEHIKHATVDPTKKMKFIEDAVDISQRDFCIHTIFPDAVHRGRPCFFLPSYEERKFTDVAPFSSPLHPTRSPQEM